MNFNYNEDQQAIEDVAVRIFRDLCGDEQLKQLYRQPQPLHKELWSQLASAGILGTPFSIQLGGSEMGMSELCLALQAQGTYVAPVPLLETIVECAMPIAQFAPEKLTQQLIPQVINGECLLAPVRPYLGLQDNTPLTARSGNDQWILDGYSLDVCSGLSLPSDSAFLGDGLFDDDDDDEQQQQQRMKLIGFDYPELRLFIDTKMKISTISRYPSARGAL